MTVVGKSSWLRWILITLLLSAVVTVGSWLVYVGSVLYVYTYEPSYRIAEYDGFYAALSVNGDRITEIEAGSDRTGDVLPNIFIRNGDGQPVVLCSLPEKWVADVAGDRQWNVEKSSRRIIYRSKGPFYCRFTFLNDRLADMLVQTNEIPFQIAPSPDGPFISLPIPVEDFLAIFGEPKKWTKGRHSRPAGMP